MYQPPFNITADIVNLVADISAQAERYAIRMEQSDALRLRKVNRIRTIHSSLAIEGNTLTEDEVADIVDGKNVVAPLREIQEVKNAISTYDLVPDLDPFSERDLLKAHGVMMHGLAADAGRYRSKGVGVFSETGLVHMAPSADRVPPLMSDLFEWLRMASDHLLIRSCVFHYEFEFIHPFSDGNGRTGRLWQSLILGRFNPLFLHLPVENMVYSNQQAYYDAIAESSAAGESGVFIKFMLCELLATLKKHQGEPLHDKLHDKFPEVQMAAWSVVDALVENPQSTAKELAVRIGVQERQVRSYLSVLKQNGIIRREGSNKTGRWIVLISERYEN